MEEKCATSFEKRDYWSALETMTGLKDPIDTFFDSVLVMAEDPGIRRNRLALLRQLSRLFSVIADFSFIGSTADTN